MSCCHYARDFHLDYYNQILTRDFLGLTLRRLLITVCEHRRTLDGIIADHDCGYFALAAFTGLALLWGHPLSAFWIPSFSLEAIGFSRCLLLVCPSRCIPRLRAIAARLGVALPQSYPRNGGCEGIPLEDAAVFSCDIHRTMAALGYAEYHIPYHYPGDASSASGSYSAQPERLSWAGSSLVLDCFGGDARQINTLLIVADGLLRCGVSRRRDRGHCVAVLDCCLILAMCPVESLPDGSVACDTLRALLHLGDDLCQPTSADSSWYRHGPNPDPLLLLRSFPKMRGSFHTLDQEYYDELYELGLLDEDEDGPVPSDATDFSDVDLRSDEESEERGGGSSDPGSG
ncbi:P0 protein [Black pepper virus E]|nr:P0 protein [Black pepper virus E]